MFYLGLIVGIFIGGNVGLIISQLLKNAKIEEEMLRSSIIALKTVTDMQVLKNKAGYFCLCLY